MITRDATRQNGRIAFLRASPGFALYTMRQDGSDARQVTPVAVRAATPPLPPVWLPDGRSITFGSKHALYRVDADGENLTRLFPHRLISCPAWSPDGRTVAFTQGSKVHSLALYGRDGIHAMRADGTDVRLLVPAAWSTTPVWAPDGKMLAFSAHGLIHVANSDGSNAKGLTEGEGVFDRHPSWSADGMRIAFSREAGQRADIYIVNLVDGGLTKLTESLDGMWSSQPNWSPDGAKIAFASNRRHRGLADIYLMNSDGARQIPLTRGVSLNYGPAWQARGV